MSPVELLYGRFSSLISEIQIPLKHPQQNPKVFQVDFSQSFCKPSSLQAFDKEGLHPFLQLLWKPLFTYRITPKKIQSEWCSWYISPNSNWNLWKGFVYSPATKIITKVSVSQAMPSRFPPWKLMMPWWNSDQCLSTLGAKNPTKTRHLLPYYPVLHVYMGHVWPDFFHQVGYVLTNHINLFIIFRLRSTLQIITFFIFAVSRVYILLPTSRYFLFAIEKKWMNFCPPQMVETQDLGVVGLPGAFRLSCHHQHAGGQDSLLAKSFKGITTGW